MAIIVTKVKIYKSINCYIVMLCYPMTPLCVAKKFFLNK